jgi:hypothetical protein
MRQRVGAIALIAGLVVVLVFFVSDRLSPRPGTVVGPEIVGRIDGVVSVGGGVDMVNVEGREVAIDRSAGGQRQLGGNRQLDGVLLYGSEPTPWFLVALPRGDGCYEPSLDMAFDAEGAVIVVDARWDVGIRLPKAPDFRFEDGGHYRVVGDGRYVGSGVEGTGPPPFCVNEDGEVIGVR